MARKIRAAGGIVIRVDPEGERTHREVPAGHAGDDREVLLVHRPHYRDWTFPKGKVDAGESDEDAAVREVWEETGYRCRLGDELPSTSYSDGYGRPKVVRYWLMEVLDGQFTPNDEVDQIAWLSIEDARRRLTYDRDRDLLPTFPGQQIAADLHK